MQCQSTVVIDRFFRTYYSYCADPNRDSLFQFFETLHSAGDRLNKTTSIDLFLVPEFVALNSLRNYYHHQGELGEVRGINVIEAFQGKLELAEVCLISLDVCNSALELVPKKHKDKVKQSFLSFNYWKKLVDIRPCIFNCATKVFESVENSGFFGESKEYLHFVSAYEFESKSGLSHYVSGAVTTHPSEISNYTEYLESLFIENFGKL